MTWGKRTEGTRVTVRCATVLCVLALDSRDPVVYNRRMAPGGGQAAGGAPLRHAASVIGVGMEDIL